MVVYAAYGKYLIVMRLSTGTILRKVEVPSNNITKPFYCGVGKYYEEILWHPKPMIEALSLHQDRLLMVVSGYFKENDEHGNFNHVLSAFMSTLVQTFDVKILWQANSSSRDGLLSTQYINGYYKYLYSIESTSYVVTQSYIDTYPLLRDPFRRYVNDGGDNGPVLSDEEYTLFVQSKREDQIELFHQALYRDLTLDEQRSFPTIANVNITLYDNSLIEEINTRYIVYSSHIVFIHSVDMMSKEPQKAVMEESQAILVPYGRVFIIGVNDSIIIASEFNPYPYCQRTIVYAVKLGNNRNTSADGMSMSIAIITGYISTRNGLNIFQETLLRVPVIVNCIEQANDMQSKVPSDTPPNQPSGSSEVASDLPSSTMSDFPSDIPSNAQSDNPSIVPTDKPSIVPSDNPSDSPSTAPSRMTPSVPPTIETLYVDQQMMIIFNISIPNLDTHIEDGMQLHGMAEITRFDFNHVSLQFYENIVYSFEYENITSPHTFYDLTDPLHPKIIAELFFDEYEQYLFRITNQTYHQTSVFLLLGPFSDRNSDLYHHIKIVDLSNPQEPMYLHNYSIPQKLKKIDVYSKKSYEDEFYWDYSNSRYTNDGFLFMPFHLYSHSFRPDKVITKYGYLVFSINVEDGIYELSQCRRHFGDPFVNYASSELQAQNDDKKKCHYCVGSLPYRTMRFDTGTKWLISNGRDSVMTILSTVNGTVTCQQEWEQAIDILAPDNQATAGCCTDPDFDYTSTGEFCCLSY
jgi:hypothetical protein